MKIYNAAKMKEVATDLANRMDAEGKTSKKAIVMSNKLLIWFVGKGDCIGTDLISSAVRVLYARETGRGAASPKAFLNYIMNSRIVIICFQNYCFLIYGPVL